MRGFFVLLQGRPSVAATEIDAIEIQWTRPSVKRCLLQNHVVNGHPTRDHRQHMFLIGHFDV